LLKTIYEDFAFDLLFRQFVQSWKSTERRGWICWTSWFLRTSSCTPSWTRTTIHK
jgi:hypothetical protein